MRNRTEVLLALCLAVMVVFVAVAMVFPGHPRLAGPTPSGGEEVTPAIFVQGFHEEPGSRRPPAAHGLAEPSGGSRCPYLSTLADGTSCPAIAEGDAASACPHVQKLQELSECPETQREKDRSACPFSGMRQQQKTAPHGKTKNPRGPHV